VQLRVARNAVRQPANGRLPEALATLISNQALFVSQMAKTDERFGKMNEPLRAPEAIRRKIGLVKQR
jgi:hypothetical protein